MNSEQEAVNLSEKVYKVTNGTSVSHVVWGSYFHDNKGVVLSSSIRATKKELAMALANVMIAIEQITGEDFASTLFDAYEVKDEINEEAITEIERQKR